MLQKLRVAVIIVILLLIIAAIYVIFSSSEEGRDKDNVPPTIDTITGHTTGTVGKITTIYVTFSDNIDVTEAILYYKTANEENWRFKSIINKSADILIPSNSRVDWWYYVTVNDAANNGPVGDPSNDGSSYYSIKVSFEDEDLTHYVFIEEGTSSWCEHCTPSRDILQELFELGKYNFYYVSLVEDKNSKAEARLKDDYNLTGYPTIFIDGGFDVIVKGKDKSVYTDAILRAEARNVANIQVTVKAEYDKNKNELKTDVIVNNYEKETYTGILRVYLTEIISRWVTRTDRKPYHYGFIDYIMNKNITVDANGIVILPPVVKKFSDFSFSDLDPDNLMVIATVFNSKLIEKYAYPPDENPFNAYYVDNVNATRVVEGGNLPPLIAISKPEIGKIHLLGIPVLKTFEINNTVLIGKTTICVNVEDDTGIEKVEFYINEKLKNTDTEEPYEWSFRKVGFFKHIIRKYTLMVKAYDEEGKTATDDIEVIAFFL